MHDDNDLVARMQQGDAAAAEAAGGLLPLLCTYRKTCSRIIGS